MNFIQTGDWHIRVRPELPQEWQINRYRRLCAEIIDLCREHEAKLFLSGDIFDRNRPSLIELQLFIECMVCISDAEIDTWLIAGNHESIGQGMSTFDFLTDVFDSINRKNRGQIHYAYPSSAWMNHRFPEEKVGFTLIGHPALPPFLEVPRQRTESRTEILITHCRATVNQFIREELDVEKLLEPFDICFASDVHDPLELYNGKLVYTNNPLSNHFEAEADHGCLLISVQDGVVDWSRIKLHLPNTIKLTTTPDQYQDPPDDGNFYRVEVIGASTDLRNIVTASENVKLLKVPEVAETYAETDEVEEIRDVSLEQALIEYMTSLQFTESKIQEMMGVYRES